MQVISVGSRLLSLNIGKAAQHTAQLASSNVSRQGCLLTSNFSVSASTLSAASQLVKRCYQANAAAPALDIQQLRASSQAVVRSTQSGQVRGFAAQALRNPGNVCAECSMTRCTASCAVLRRIICLYGLDAVCVGARAQHVATRQQSTLAASLPGAANTAATVSTKHCFLLQIVSYSQENVRIQLHCKPAASDQQHLAAAASATADRCCGSDSRLE